MQERLATEILRELHRESKRRFLLLLICIVLLFASNLAWLIAWNLPDNKETVTESYDLQGEDSANVFYNGEGEVTFNGENQSDKDENSSNSVETTAQ
jgi:hypothetical protein